MSATSAWRERVIRLKSVDLPTLGRPTSTIVGFIARMKDEGGKMQGGRKEVGNKGDGRRRKQMVRFAHSRLHPSYFMLSPCSSSFILQPSSLLFILHPC